MLKHDDSDINNQNNKGKTLLHAAAHYSNDSDIIKLLLSYGADPSITDEQGKYPMDDATSSKIIDILYKAYFSTLTSFERGLLFKSMILNFFYNLAI
ncbi:ankyrin repeat domain-containing protein [Orientia tsutsugamushi]|uniref:ankyrin repeat domain-containing protein n=1 Tax=Orientia tsutsugamushi TaxID=784 RepID=UPI0035297F74